MNPIKISTALYGLIERATATNTNQPENLGAANTNKGGEA